jgi:DNA/RNA-binding domain of Phe-tRNA-synthetase-like protein
MEVEAVLESLVPRLDPGVRPIVRVGALCAAPVAVGPSEAPLLEETADTAASLRSRFEGRAPGEIGALGYARDLYKAFGIDPTRYRPSSEALLRRVIKGKPLPTIFNAVDLCNLCSLRFLLPLGLYDTAKVDPPVVLRKGREGEAYPGIRKDEVHLHGRPVLADATGAFGNPTSDSLRTSVSPDTASLLMVIFAPASYPAEMMEENVRAACDLMERHLAPAGKPVRTAGEGLP